MQNWNGGTYSGAAAVTPSDTTLITCRALYVGTSASATVVINPGAAGGTSVTFTNVVQGSILPVELNQGRVMAASTATNIVALT